MARWRVSRWPISRWTAPLTLISLIVLAGCAAPISALRDEAVPANAVHKVKAALEAQSKSKYSAVLTIENQGDETLHLSPAMFQLEGSPPTQFVQAERTTWFRPGFQLPSQVAPGTTAQGEIFFKVRGTPQPVGPVDLVVDLPDGEHRFTFEVF